MDRCNTLCCFAGGNLRSVCTERLSLDLIGKGSARGVGATEADRRKLGGCRFQ
jgi:hypothetical protein